MNLKGNTMTTTETLKLALEALEGWKEYMPAVWEQNDEKAITALREALASQGEALASEAIEQKSGIKQVIELYDSPDQPAQQQEHVSVMTVLHLKDRTEIGYGPASAGYDLPTGEYKLYTSTPTQRTWVGLTAEERNTICENAGTWREAMKVIEAKLKAKNSL
jgi:hypothetical protein